MTAPSPDATVTSPVGARDVSGLTAVGCTLLALGSLGYVVAGVLTGGEAGRAGFLHPVNAPASGLAAVGATLLTLALASWRPPAIPTWAVRLAAAGMVSVAAGAWLSASVLVGLAQQSPSDEAFLAAGASWWALAFLAPKAVQLLALPVIAVAGWRGRTLPRSACVALALAGLLSLWPPFPPGGLLVSLALFLVSRRPMPG